MNLISVNVGLRGARSLLIRAGARYHDVGVILPTCRAT